ncbi:MAG: CDP-alcohol phosphatidyltransferase family protein [Chloroflexota bacterium]
MFKGVIEPVAGFFNRLGLRPNTMTLLGLAGSAAGAYLLSRGQIVPGGILLAIVTPFDALDGTMARLRGESSDWGAFVDSVTDRYSELFVLGGLLYHFIQHDNHLASMLIYIAAGGSLMVSYTKARADSLNYEAKIGLLTRVERYLVIIPLLILNQPVLLAWLVAIFANFTAFQRIFFVRRQARAKMKQL